MSMILTPSRPSRMSLAASLPSLFTSGLRLDTHSRPWREWLGAHFASYTFAPFADRHIRFWDWIATLQPGVRPRARVEVWSRGGAKSSTLELGCTYIGSEPTPRRHYVLYVSNTQAQANKHVAAIAGMLERVGVQRAINEYGSSKGWRHEEIRTANGFNVTAFGLDSGMRGVKLDEYRPDIIIFDDIDGRHDTVDTVSKKVDVITTTVLPSGSTDCAVIVIQNKIHKDGIVSQLCDGRADFLHDRLPATVEPAITGLQYEQRIQPDGTPRYAITGGQATWAGQNVATCEQQINEWGLGAFLREAQHEVDEVEGGLWQKARDIDTFRVPAGQRLPEMDIIAVAVDPNTEGTGDEAGIIVTSTSRQWDERMWDRPHAYVLADYTVSGGPKAWAEASVAAYHDFNADLLIAEKNNGGQMVAITIGTISGAPGVMLVHASRGKRTRAEPVQKLYEDGRVHHLKLFPELERQMCTWKPGMPSPDRMDALVWGLSVTMLGYADDESDDVIAQMNRELA
jgi:hypothetical protein